MDDGTMDQASADRRDGGHHWFVRMARWSIWPFLFAPITIILHEVSHFVVGLALGVPEPRLHYSAISHGDLSSLPGWAYAASSAAGPLMSVAMSVFASWLVIGTQG